MYWTISVTVSALAAYGSAELLWLQLLLLPLVMTSRRDVFAALILFTVSLLSYFYFQSYITNHTPAATDDPLVLNLKWTETVKIDGAKVKGFAVDASGIVYYLIYTIQNEKEKDTLQTIHLPGREAVVRGVTEPPEPPAHEYSFDMAAYLKMNGAAVLFRADEMTLRTRPNSPIANMSEQRNSLKEHISRVFPASLQSEAEALLIGDRTGMDPELSSQYRTLGITHLFAISGLHVGLLTIMLRTAAKRSRMRLETVDTLLLFLLPCYALLAGGAPSVWRAVTVTMIILLAATGRIRLKMDDALALSALGFIILKPYVLFQPGFQLSYAAAFSLLYSAGFLSKQQSVIALSAAVTAITQVALAPILLYHFYELSLSSFLVNLVYVPLYSIVILPSNIVMLLVSLVSEKAVLPLFFIYEPFRTAVTSATSWLASLPWQVWVPGKPSVLWIVVMMLCILAAFISVERTNKKRAGVMLVIIPSLLFQLKPYLDPVTYVTYLDVGQGDSIVIELAYRKGVYVIDTGGSVSFGPPTWKTPEKSFEVGRQIVVPYLKGKGIQTIDKLILSHAHNDHMEGADEVLQELRVKEVHTPVGSLEEETMVPVIAEAKRQRVDLLDKQAGEGWSMGNTEFLYLSPFDDIYSPNNSSLVLLMRNEYGYLLFTGDLELEGEQKLVREFGHTELNPLILKVGHHGSETSTSQLLLDFLEPDAAIISAGRNNRYGHPHADVVNRLKDQGTEVYSTATHGTVVVQMKGKQSSISHIRGH